MDFDAEAIIRMVFATILGAAVGVEREVDDQPAGMRTHIAVSLGAALFGIVSTLGFQEYVVERAASNINVDVTRVASQVVVAIGFLGAGMIFRQGTAVKNLTTGASLWTTAAIGLACGVGDSGTAAVATGILLIGLVALRPLRDWIRNTWTREHRTFSITMAEGVDPSDVIEQLNRLDDVESISTGVEKRNRRAVVIAELSAHPSVDLDAVMLGIVMRDDVVTCGERDTDEA